MVRWPSGQAAVCKTVHNSSSLFRTSVSVFVWLRQIWRSQTKPSTSVQIWYGPHVVSLQNKRYTCSVVFLIACTIMDRKRSWSESDLKEAVKNSKSIRQVLKCLNLRMAGGNYAQINKYIKKYKISTVHFTGRAWNKGMTGIGKPRIELAGILKKNVYFQSYKLKKRLFEAGMKSQRCEECGWHKKSADGRIPLELDHVNGDNRDNRIENLRVLCPNCHSLKATHRGRNIKKKM